VIAAFCGAALTGYFQRKFFDEAFWNNGCWLIAVAFGFFVFEFTVFSGLRRPVEKIVRAMKLTASTKRRFLNNHIFTYLVFLVQGLTLGGARPNLAMVMLLLVLFTAAQFLFLLLAADRAQKEKWLGSAQALPLLFFVSGFSALIYQIVWQRVLFATFGTNTESVTVIVSVFMFGLGLGALAGGQIQKFFANRLLQCFIIIELAIGLFGMISIPYIHLIGRLVPHNSLPVLVGTTFLLLIFPTMLMGSTLPVLVGYMRKRFTSAGAMVGQLYAYNAFGSAFAAFLTVTLVFTILGQQATLILAACCNALTAYMVWRISLQKPTHASTTTELVNDKRKSSHYASFQIAYFLAAMIGLISLSLEILWMRIFGFMTANRPQTFGFMLAIYLGGIAYGSLKAKRWSEQGKNPYSFISRALLKITIFTFLSVPLVGLLSAWLAPQFGLIAGFILLGFLSCFAGAIFPLLCQIGATSRSKQTGVIVAWLYFLNILGATAGTLITGFVLFDEFTLGQNTAIITAMSFLVWLTVPRKFSTKGFAVCAAALVAAILIQPRLYENIVANLQSFPLGTNLAHISENRHGIITVESDPESDIIFGNGAYDGRFNIDPIKPGNIITRAYMVMAMHPHPKRILEIGLSGGAWGKVFSMYQPLRELIGVEIDAGYLGIMDHYPQIASLKNNPKWKYYVDDGRRWLTNHPDERFDAIVMNTSYYWRSNASNVLSREFLELCKHHLNPGGILFYNATTDWDVVYTAANVFKYVVPYVNFVFASDAPFNMSAQQRKENLLRFVGDDGQPIFANANPEYSKLLEELATTPMDDIHNEILTSKNLWEITDDNMASEYRVDQGFLPAHFRW